MWRGYVGGLGPGKGGRVIPRDLPRRGGVLSSHTDLLSLLFEHLFTGWHRMIFQAHLVFPCPSPESVWSKELWFFLLKDGT